MAHISQMKVEPELNYFVCTLGQAAITNAENPHGFQTVNNFLDLQARLIPQNPAVGFPIPSKSRDGDTQWQQRILSMFLSYTEVGTVCRSEI